MALLSGYTSNKAKPTLTQEKTKHFNSVVQPIWGVLHVIR